MSEKLRTLLTGPRTIRWSIFRNFLLLIVGLSAALLATTFFGATRLVEQLSRELINRTADQVLEKLSRFLEPVENDLRVVRDLGEAGAFDPLSETELNPIFAPLLKLSPQVSSVNIGDEAGNGYMLLREEDGWLNRFVRAGEDGTLSYLWIRWSQEFHQVDTWTDETETYDPRVRPWYVLAMQDTAVNRSRWTSPYIFHTTKDPGVTVSMRMETPDGRRCVVALDVLLNDITSFTMNATPSEHGMAFIFTVTPGSYGLVDSTRMIGLPRHASLDDPQVRERMMLKSIHDLGIAAVADGTRAFERGVEAGRISVALAATYDFESEGERWWASVKPYRMDDDLELRIVATVPLADFLGDVVRQRVAIIIAMVGAIALAAFLALALAKRYSRPIDSLIERSDALGRLDVGDRPPVDSSLAEVQRLAEAQDRMRAALHSFATYVPTDVVRELLKQGEAARIGGKVETLTCLFTDIQGFTSIAESMSATKLTEHMAAYFEGMLQIIASTQATVDKLIGDAIVAFWGAPNADPNHAMHAATAVLKCREWLDAQNERWKAEGLPALPTRFGLATGHAVVGNVGSPSRLNYTALGDTVNLASRLEGVNRIYGTYVLASEQTVETIGDAIEWKRIDRITVRGRMEPVTVYEPLGWRGRVSEELMRAARRYEEALDLYVSRKFDEARQRLETEKIEAVRQITPERRLADQCTRFMREPPPDDWDGVTRTGDR